MRPLNPRDRGVTSMEQAKHTIPHHRRITVALVFMNLAAILYALHAGGPGARGYHFRGESFISWLGSAQMFGAGLLFTANYFASLIIKQPGESRRAHLTWLVFAAGFFLLALDQQFRLREELTILLEGGLPAQGQSSATFAVLKWGAGALSVALVFVFRATVLANFRMVVAFFAGFWFLVCMLLADLLVEGIVGPGDMTAVIEGSAKLLAIAMFLSASYAALLDRLTAAALAVENAEASSGGGQGDRAASTANRRRAAVGRHARDGGPWRGRGAAGQDGAAGGEGQGGGR